MSVVDTAVRGAVMTVTLNDEARRNALSNELMGELLDAIDLAEATPSIRVVVVTNRGSTFCAGADLTALSKRTTTKAPRVELAELFRRIRRSPLPFVGRLAGHCVAGGVGLAAVMDVAVAKESATFGFSEVRIGVAPAVISVVCLAKMRRVDAAELFLRGQRFRADEAVRVGLIAASVPEEELDHEVRAVVNDLLAGEPTALAAAKRLVHLIPELTADEAFPFASAMSASLFQSPEAHEGMAAFFEKRPAAWVQTVDETTD